MSTQEKEAQYGLMAEDGLIPFTKEEFGEILTVLNQQGREYLSSGSQHARSAWSKIEESNVLETVPSSEARS